LYLSFNHSLASFLVSNLDDSILKCYMDQVPTAEEFDGNAMWCWLKSKYSTPTAKSQHDSAVENKILRLLLSRPSSQRPPLSPFLSSLREKVTPICLHKRLCASKSTVTMLAALVVRHVLNIMADICRGQDQRYMALLVEYNGLLSAGDVFPAPLFDALQARVEQIDVACASLPSAPSRGPGGDGGGGGGGGGSARGGHGPRRGGGGGGGGGATGGAASHDGGKQGAQGEKGKGKGDGKKGGKEKGGWGSSGGNVGGDGTKTGKKSGAAVKVSALLSAGVESDK
jgi:hypothetical protein